MEGRDALFNSIALKKVVVSVAAAIIKSILEFNLLP